MGEVDQRECGEDRLSGCWKRCVMRQKEADQKQVVPSTPACRSANQQAWRRGSASCVIPSRVFGESRHLRLDDFHFLMYITHGQGTSPCSRRPRSTQPNRGSTLPTSTNKSHHGYRLRPTGKHRQGSPFLQRPVWRDARRYQAVLA